MKVEREQCQRDKHTITERHDTYTKQCLTIGFVLLAPVLATEQALKLSSQAGGCLSKGVDAPAETAGFSPARTNPKRCDTYVRQRSLRGSICRATRAWRLVT